VSNNNEKKTSAEEKKASATTIGDFELRKKLGKGGMGEVFLARQISLDRLVALKTLSKTLAKEEDFVARFLREARSMAKLDHANVVKVYAVDSFKGIHFAAIEYVDGKSVQDWLNKLKTFSIGDAVHIAMVSAEALKHAHDQNMVHRDIKPDNILLTSKGVVKVADFGLAKVMDEDVSMTKSGTGMGTPLYMPPEQARSAKTVDQRSDIYALGATLYHMLTGKLPFTGSTALELILAKEMGRYESAGKVREGIPERLDLVIDKMMAKDPKHRYSDCATIVNDLATLGLHSPALTFMDGAVPISAARSVMPTTQGQGKTVIAARNSSPASRTDARKTGKKKPSRMWYVQYQNAKKETVVEKQSTGRILKMISAGILTAKARCKMSADGGYVPVGQFPEFKEAIAASLSRHSARAQKSDMKTLYTQVERDQKRRARWRWFTNKLRALVGAMSLLLWLAFVSAALGLAYYFGRDQFVRLGEKVKEMLN